MQVVVVLLLSVVVGVVVLHSVVVGVVVLLSVVVVLLLLSVVVGSLTQMIEQTSYAYFSLKGGKQSD